MPGTFIIPSTLKQINMKSFKLLMLAACSIFSISLFAQDTTKQHAKMKTNKMATVKYSCPMHPEVIRNKPGKCPKCGMDLVKAKKTAMKMGAMHNYSCPMHSEVTSDKPGTCSKCGMDLKESKMEQMKMYACPMHPDITSDEPGKCSKCGMDLKKSK